MYSTWVVEDNPIQLAGIVDMLDRCKYADALLVTALNGRERLMEELDCVGKEDSPKIVLMDMDLGGGAYGADFVAEQPALKHAQIIYVTAYLRLVPEAYRTRHLYTLAKPIKMPQLDSAIEKAIAGIESKSDDALILSYGSEIVRIPCSSVIWMESRGHKVEVFTDKGVFLATEPLRSLCEKLPANFVRLHKSYVANLLHAFLLEQNDLVMSNGSRLPVSRTYRKSVKEGLMTQLKGL